MDSIQEHRWNRSSYPLQPSSAPRRLSVITTTPKGSDASQRRLPENTQGLISPTSQLPVSPDRTTRRYSITSQSGNDTNVLRRQSPKNDSAESISRSQSSLPPPTIQQSTIQQSSRSWLSNTSGSPSSAKHLTNAQDEVTSVTISSTRNNYPLQTLSQASSEHRSITPTSLVETEDAQYMPTRTLRRTSRNRRIDSPKTSMDGRENSLPLSFAAAERDSSARAQPSSPETFTNLLESAVGRASKIYLGESPEDYDGFTAARLPLHKDAGINGPELIRGSEPRASSKAAQEDQKFTANNAKSQPAPNASTSTGDELEADGKRHPERTPLVDQVGRKDQIFRRQAYPLQSPASNATLRHPPSPPLSPQKESQNVDALPAEQTPHNGQVGTENRMSTRQAHLQAFVAEQALQPQQGSDQTSMSHAEETQGNDKTGAKKQSFPRQAYPLQSPASTMDLRRSPTPPLSSPQSQSSRANDVPTDYLRVTGKGHVLEKQFHRQMYPLQSPASVTNLRRSPTPPSSANSETINASQLSTGTAEEDSQVVKTSNLFRRQVYPLQSPASTMNLKQSSTPPTSSMYSASINISPPSTESLYGKIQTATESCHPAHHIYPFQAPVEVPSVRISASPSPATIDHTFLEGDRLSTKEYGLATKVTEQWRRQTYPLQSPKDIPTWRSQTPLPPGEDRRTSPKADKIHLPKNIRAVKDAEEQQSKGRTIIVCLDGTGDKFDNDNSNIVHLISALKKDDPQQVSYYQAGIGTYGASGLSYGFEAALDMAVGSGLGLHVRDAYHFLMHSYKEGDKICIFGFSRGAYTARCLAGMIHKVGLLPPRNIQQIPFAYEFYANDTPEGWKQSGDFKRTFCIDVSVYFLGCFDSVASVGFIPRQLPLSSTPTSKPRYFRHAMALDERRAKFKVCRHQRKDLKDIEKPLSPTEAIAKVAPRKPFPFKPRVEGDPSDHAKFGQSHHPNMTDEEYEGLMGHEAPFDTDVLEVWFAGAHADIGGGAVPNEERHKLAQIPLRWMIRQAFECDTGIIFKTKVLAEYGLDIHTLWPKYERLGEPKHGPPPSFLEKFSDGLPPKSIRRSKLVPIDKFENGEPFYHLKSHTDEDWTPEQVEDFYDAMTPIHDQLIQAPTWWILEYWPVQYLVPKAPGEVIERVGMNLGRYRGVADFEPNLHWTVLHRMQHLGYRIRARTAAHTKWRTVV